MEIANSGESRDTKVTIRVKPDGTVTIDVEPPPKERKVILLQ